MSDQILKNFKNDSNSQDTFHYDWIWVLKLFGIFLGPFLVIFDDFSDPRVILEVKIGCFAFFELLTSNSSRTLKSAYFLIPSKPRAPLCLSFLEECPKKAFFYYKRVTSHAGTVQPENEGYPKNGPVEKMYPPKILLKLHFLAVSNIIFWK